MPIPYSTHPIQITNSLSFAHTVWLLGAILPLWWVYLEVKQQKFHRSKTFWVFLTIFVFFGAYIGARLFHYGGPWGRGWVEWAGFFDLSRGGAVFYGGLFGVMIAAYAYLKIRREEESAKIFDFIAPALALTLFSTRLFNCFFVGDDFGTASNLPWAIEYLEGGHVYLLRQTIHPVQIYLSLGNLLIFIALLEIRFRKKWNGQVFTGYLILYGMMRFLIEFFRDTTESKASALTMLTYSQMISIILIIGGMGYLLSRRRKNLHKRVSNEEKEKSPSSLNKATRIPLKVAIAVGILTIGFNLFGLTTPAQAQLGWTQQSIPELGNIQDIKCVSTTECLAGGGPGSGFTEDIARTTDAGVTWSSVDAVSNAFFNQVFEISLPDDFATQGVAYARSLLITLSKTEDFGVTWTSTESFGQPADALDFLNKDTGFVIDNLGRVFKTTTGGTGVTPWTQVGQLCPALGFCTATDVDFVNVNEGWAVGFDSTAVSPAAVIHRTQDGGVTWTQTVLPITISTSVAVQNPNAGQS